MNRTTKVCLERLHVFVGVPRKFTHALAGVAAAIAVMSIAVAPGGAYAETVSRCDQSSLSHKDLQELQKLSDALKKDAFSEAYGIFIRDLDQAAESFRNIEAKEQDFNRNRCRPHNAEVDRYEEDNSKWTMSHCVIGPLTQEEVPGCVSRKGELDGWRTRLQNQYTQYLGEFEGIVKELNDAEARADKAVLNAENMLNPEYVEDALRLYTWYVLHRKERGELTSCGAFAVIADKLGERVPRQDSFVNFLTRGFIETGGFGALPHLFIGDPPFRPSGGSTFDASGFKRKFVDRAQDNQVRHAANYMVIGFKIGPGTAAVNSLIFDIAEKYRHGDAPENGDYYLAVSAAQLGFRLKYGYFRTRDFGAAIRKELCQ